MEELVAKIREAKLEQSPSRAMLAFARQCYQTWSDNYVTGVKGPELVDLLLGIKESDDEVQAGKFGEVVALGDILTAPLEVLLKDDVVGQTGKQLSYVKLFYDGRELFLKALTTKRDLCAGKLLERGFLWALACASAKMQRLRFSDTSFEFACAAIQPGRIFEQQAQTTCSLIGDRVQELQDGILYFADEDGPSHPRADMWFRTQHLGGKPVLVLVEVGGTDDEEKGRKKVQTMQSTLAEEQGKCGLGLVGVVLLPNVELGSIEEGHLEDTDLVGMNSCVTIVTGREARRLLGGLVQLLTWLGDDAS
jgi:hypothetical protein